MTTCRSPARTVGPSWSSCTRPPSQAEAFTFYRLEAQRLAAGGWYPIAHSWGDEPPSTGFAAAFGYTAASVGAGTLLVTYRHMGQA